MREDKPKSRFTKPRKKRPQTATVVDPTPSSISGPAVEVIDEDGDVLIPEVVDVEVVDAGEPLALDEDKLGQQLDGEINLAEIDGDTGIESDSYEADTDGDEPYSVESSSTGLVRYDPLQTYLAEIRRHPLLSKEEEHKLAVRYQRHKDVEAARKLIVSNLRLVVLIAREYQRNSRNLLDLVQEGNIGLLEAVKQFDPFRGIRFPTYAAYWIRAYMLRHIINNLRLVKIGTTQAQRKLFFNLQKEKEKLEAEGFAPEAKLLADRLAVKESEVIEMEQRLGLPDVSVDAPMGSGDEPVTLHNLLSDPSENVEHRVVNRQFDDALRQAIEEFKKTADDKEKAIIDRRLFTEDPITLQEIAADFDLSRERIRQIESRLKERLKEYLAERLNLGDGGEVVVDET